MNDILEEFTRNLNNYLTGRDDGENGRLIKTHFSNLQELGEFSFPNTTKSWHEYIDNRADMNECSFLTYVKKDGHDIMNESNKWKLPVRNVKLMNGRVHLFLDRSTAIRVALESCSANNDWIMQKLNDKQNFVSIDPSCEGPSVTSLRVRCIARAVNGLVAIESGNEAAATRMMVTSRSSHCTDPAQQLLCGAVINANTNLKENTISGDDFIKLRQNELMLIAQHKYGLRAGSEPKWREFVEHLGRSAATFELLQTQPSSAVKINFDRSTGCSKGAAFILYNCARLEALLRTYHQRVVDGTYPPLPHIQNTDFTLLTQEEEWALALAGAGAGACGARGGARRPHRLCAALGALAAQLSRYYARTRILTEPRAHLLPRMFARLHMLQILNETLKTNLRILNIKSVSQMYTYFHCYPFTMIYT